MTQKQYLLLVMILVPLIGLYFNVFALFLVLPLWLIRPKNNTIPLKLPPEFFPKTFSYFQKKNFIFR